MVAHGQLEGRTLVKRGKQVQKFVKYGGYAVSIDDILRVDRVRLYTKNDGVIEATKQTFDRHSIPHLFRDKNGALEHQLVLPIEFWEPLQTNFKEEK